MDPAMNGAEAGPGADQQMGSSDGGTALNNDQMKAAKRAHARAVLTLMKTARLENPDLPQRDAYHLAAATLDAYPITVQAGGWDAVNFGNRGPVKDGPMVQMLKNWSPATKPAGNTKAPAGAPADSNAPSMPKMKEPTGPAAPRPDDDMAPYNNPPMASEMNLDDAGYRPRHGQPAEGELPRRLNTPGTIASLTRRADMSGLDFGNRPPPPDEAEDDEDKGGGAGAAAGAAIKILPKILPLLL